MEHRSEKHWDFHGSKIIECRDCGFRHILPLPDEQHIEDFYKQLYYKHIKYFDYKGVTADYIKRQLQYVDHYSLNIETFKSVTRFFEENFTGSMIDIGCGNSLLSKYFQNRGWTTYGVEPGADAAAYLRKFGLEIFEIFVEEIDTIDLTDISLINMQFVLEHLRNPRLVLEKLYQILKPGGILRVCVPNDFSEGQLAYTEFFQTEPNWVSVPDHINYFNFDSLSQLIKRVGFEEVYRTTNFPLEFLLLGGNDYYNNEVERMKVGSFVKNFEDALIKTERQKILSGLYEKLAELGLGRSIFMIVRKPF